MKPLKRQRNRGEKGSMNERPDQDPEGMIFNIQRFSLHDGPGIRTTVFLKGCPLRCDWCSNPESQSPSPQLMVRQVACIGCGQCLASCPRGALSLKAERRSIDWVRCDQCLQCVEACLYQSLLLCGRSISTQEVVRECLRDKPFYDRSGGGVTLSGGEPLGQARFVLQVLGACKALGLHTALDTSGYAPWPVLESVLAAIDLLLFDLKHLDPERHRQVTGLDNALILENLEKAASSGARIWLRIPLIADLNDGEEHFRQVCLLALDRRIEKISLLLYHEGGKSKAEQTGRPYRAGSAAAPSPERLELLRKIADEHRILVSVGH